MAAILVFMLTSLEIQGENSILAVTLFKNPARYIFFFLPF